MFAQGWVRCFDFWGENSSIEMPVTEPYISKCSLAGAPQNHPSLSPLHGHLSGVFKHTNCNRLTRQAHPTPSPLHGHLSGVFKHTNYDGLTTQTRSIPVPRLHDLNRIFKHKLCWTEETNSFHPSSKTS